MGLGPLDAILGAAVALLILLFRRRLTWVRSTARDLGVLGTALAVIAITIFVGGALFTLRVMPGPAFTVGAVATSVVILAVRRRMDGLRLVPRPPFLHKLDPRVLLEPLVLVGVVAARPGWRLRSMPRGLPMLPTSMRSSGLSPSNPGCHAWPRTRPAGLGEAPTRGYPDFPVAACACRCGCITSIFRSS